MVFNNTNNSPEFKPELELESPTIGYRSKENKIKVFSFFAQGWKPYSTFTACDAFYILIMTDDSTL